VWALQGKKLGEFCLKTKTIMLVRNGLLFIDDFNKNDWAYIFLSILEVSKIMFGSKMN